MRCDARAVAGRAREFLVGAPVLRGLAI
eukprot:COSAG06_NODE_39167_length_415_cov_1.471519_2_plen_27_part_01